MKLDNGVVAEHPWVNVIEELHDVKVWASQSFYSPADAQIRNLVYKTGE